MSRKTTEVRRALAYWGNPKSVANAIGMDLAQFEQIYAKEIKDSELDCMTAVGEAIRDLIIDGEAPPGLLIFAAKSRLGWREPPVEQVIDIKVQEDATAAVAAGEERVRKLRLVGRDE